jgi:CDP-6-deoxy-D-xylo-4-hexulose-3-dehydrase
MQAACGLAQLDRLPGFIAQRRRNFAGLKERLLGCQSHLILPEATPGSDPSWFGFPITLREDAGLSRNELVQGLDEARIGTRLLFGGNLVRQPYMAGQTYRVAGSLARTDAVMNRTFWIGVHPGLTEPMLDHLADTLKRLLGA